MRLGRRTCGDGDAAGAPECAGASSHEPSNVARLPRKLGFLVSRGRLATSGHSESMRSSRQSAVLWCVPVWVSALGVRYFRKYVAFSLVNDFHGPGAAT